MKAFDVAILDYDGTLSDTRPAIAHCLARAFAMRERPVPRPELVTAAVNAGLSLPDTCRRLAPALAADKTALDDLVGTYRTLYRSEGEPLANMFPGTQEVLQRLDGEGVGCVVVSNKGIEAVRRSLDRSGLAGFVRAVFADQPGMPNKPDPALLADHILPAFPHARRERILMVGDTEIDIHFARTAGLISCWAAYGFGDAERCRALAPDHQIENIAELPAIVLQAGLRSRAAIR